MKKIISGLADRLYNQPIMNNSDRGNYAEQLVASALGKLWKPVGSGWHLWDFEGRVREKRIRIQVKQSAARQLWTPKKKPSHAFSVEAKNRPDYILRDHPKEKIEGYGRFCEIYIFAWHGIGGERCDQRIPEQWIFFVVPEKSLGKMKRIPLKKLEGDWLQKNGGVKSDWKNLRKSVLNIIKKII
ncbi:MAG: hypothetical protein NTW66_00505 [Candidatus Magasanikbacteria bacterium]|nr:hypothetical protein [Candidatus Magasanikbacteria bacterium]